jgi:hypothetical protein
LRAPGASRVEDCEQDDEPLARHVISIGGPIACS